VTFSRSALALTAAMLVAGCAGKNQLDETGGLKVTRSVCPAVAVAAYTGDVSLFSPAESRDARALDVSATITNLQTVCDQATSPVKANVTFDVVARRASGSGARVAAFGRASAAAEVDRTAASLPQAVSERLNRKRKATDADASIDPMADPRTRAAVSQASFELLIGFQLTQSQLAYNATR
jgi:hypothetical protein